MTRLYRYLIPSLADVIFLCILLSLCFTPNKGLLNDGDTGYHIRAGEYILDTLSLPDRDPFSYLTPPLPWTVHEWFSEVIMALAHRAAGLSGVVVLFSLVLATTFYLLQKSLKAQGSSSLPAAAATVLVIAASTVHWLARPHLFSLLLLVAWLHILNGYEYHGRKRLYLLPLLMLPWVNLHGGYIIGFVLLGIYLAGHLLQACTDPEEWRRHGRDKAKDYGRIIGLCMGTALLNPFGWKIFLFPFKLVFDKYLMDHTSEFLSPNFHEQPLFRALFLLLILLLALSRKRPNLTETALILFFVNMSLYSVRYVPLFALIAAPIMLRRLELAPAGPFPRLREFIRKRVATVADMDGMACGFVWPTSALLLVMLQLNSGSLVHGFDPDKKAVHAIEFIKRHQIPGNMFNNDEIGDLIIYCTHKQYKVFVDGRLDMYGSRHMQEYFKVTSFAPGWEEVLQRHHIGWIINYTDTDQARFLACRPDWRLIYSDKVASIFVRNTPEYAELAARYPNVRLANAGSEKK